MSKNIDPPDVVLNPKTPVNDLTVEEYEQMLLDSTNSIGYARLSINFLELFTSLVFLGYLEPFFEEVAIPIPPGYTVTVNDIPPVNKVVLTTENRFVVSADGVLSLTVFNDGREVINIPNMIQALYDTPIDYFRLGALVPTVNKTMAVFINSDLVNTQTFNFVKGYASMSKDLFASLINVYFKLIQSTSQMKVK